MSTPTRYDQLVTRNRFRRTRDLIGAAVSVAVARSAPTPVPLDDRADQVMLDRYAAP